MLKFWEVWISLFQLTVCLLNLYFVVLSFLLFSFLSLSPKLSYVTSQRVPSLPLLNELCHEIEIMLVFIFCFHCFRCPLRYGFSPGYCWLCNFEVCMVALFVYTSSELWFYTFCCHSLDNLLPDIFLCTVLPIIQFFCDCSWKYTRDIKLSPSYSLWITYQGY